MKWLAILLFVLPIYLPIVSNCTAYYYVGPEMFGRCPLEDEPQPCYALCDGIYCWPPCHTMP